MNTLNTSGSFSAQRQDLLAIQDQHGKSTKVGMEDGKIVPLSLLQRIGLLFGISNKRSDELAAFLSIHPLKIRSVTVATAQVFLNKKEAGEELKDKVRQKRMFGNETGEKTKIHEVPISNEERLARSGREETPEISRKLDSGDPITSDDLSSLGMSKELRKTAEYENRPRRADFHDEFEVPEEKLEAFHERKGKILVDVTVITALLMANMEGKTASLGSLGKIDDPEYQKIIMDDKKLHALSNLVNGRGFSKEEAEKKLRDDITASLEQDPAIKKLRQEPENKEAVEKLDKLYKTLDALLAGTLLEE